MVSEVPPGDLEVNPDLEDARPLTYSEFRGIKGGEIDPTDLPEEKAEFYQSVTELAGSIKENRQHYPVTTRRTDDGQRELVTGYRRFLACMYIGCPVKVETRRMSSQDVLTMIYNENENREDLEAEERARLIAKKMGRWSDDEGFIPEDHEDADPDAQTIVEFSKETGKNRGLIYQQLSPLRQNQEMRDDFGEMICETSFELIERVASNTSEQYTLAQALARSDVDTHSNFHSVYKIAERKDSDTLEEMCRRLLGVEQEEVEGSYVPPEERVSDTFKSIQKKEKQKRAEEEQERQEIEAGHSMDHDTGSSRSLEVNVGGPENVESDTRPQDKSGELSDSGNGVLPPSRDQPARDTRIDVSIPAGQEIARLVREECEDSDKSHDDFVTEVLKIHFRRNGQLSDTPELSTGD